MDQELSLGSELGLGTWLKSDLLTEFSELLDEGPINSPSKAKDAITLGTEDLLDISPGTPAHGSGTQEVCLLAQLFLPIQPPTRSNLHSGVQAEN